MENRPRENSDKVTPDTGWKDLLLLVKTLVWIGGLLLGIVMFYDAQDLRERVVPSPETIQKLESFELRTLANLVDLSHSNRVTIRLNFIAIWFLFTPFWFGNDLSRIYQHGFSPRLARISHQENNKRSSIEQ